MRIKTTEAIKNYLQTVPAKTLKQIEREYLNDSVDTELLMELQWKRFFNSYAMAFNKQHDRKGNLFQRPFKRVEVIKESHFTQAIIYVHANAQRHKLCKDFTQHKWSSWHTMLSDKPTHLAREEVIEWFGGRKQFMDVHKRMTDFYFDCDVSIEDDD